MKPEDYEYVLTCVAISFAGKGRAEDGQTVNYPLNSLFYSLETPSYRRFRGRRKEGASYHKRSGTAYLKMEMGPLCQ